MLEIKKVVRRIPAEQYGFYEVELEGFKDIYEIEEMAKDQTDKIEPKRYETCEHRYLQYIDGNKDGNFWQGYKCKACGAAMFRDSSGYSAWKPPRDKSLKI